MLNEIGTFVGLLLQTLLSLLPGFAAAWVLTALGLALLFGGVKNRVRTRVTQLDNDLRALAGRMRYRSAEDEASDRVLWTWFFRFWTNFASAPSLSFFSLAIPFVMWQRALSELQDSSAAFDSIQFWLLPGICYAGSMLLSFVLKRVFKRVRPPRKGEAFGYKLKDPSFPSGHSLTSFCFWFMLAVVVVGSGLSPLGAGVFTVFALAIPLLTGWSRIYLGVHFPSDVMGGFIIGAAWCAVCYIAFPNLHL